MTKKNPDDSVREEQFGANENAAGTEDATTSRRTRQNNDSLDDSAENTDEKQEDVIENEEDVIDEVIPSVKLNMKNINQKMIHAFDDIELPPVDYSGYTKHELVETMGLLIENRPPAEIRDDVERIKILFYKKLKLEAEERKNKFLEGGGKIEEYRAWVDPDDAQGKTPS